MYFLLKVSLSQMFKNFFKFERGYMKNNFPIFGIIVALLIIFRWLIADSEYLVQAIAIINLLAFLIVILSITIQIKKALVEKIRKSNVPQDISFREIKTVQKTIDWFTYAPLVPACIVYFIAFASPFGNDIISIVALCLSLSDTYIINTIVSIYKL